MKPHGLDEVIALVSGLSPIDKVRLVERVMATLEEDLQSLQPKTSLYGLWTGVNASGDDLDEARATAWKNFPREDI